MDKKTIERIQERIEAEKPYHDDLRAYDKMLRLEWDLPGNWAAKDWVRKNVSTDAHDAIKSATNIYDTNKPKWEILPRGEADKDAAEELETALEWWMLRANKTGEGEPFRESLHNSCLQNRVIYQLDYLPYWLPKDKKSWSKEQKAAMKQSSFCITVHDAKTVFFEMGKYGVKWAASVTVVPAQDVIDHWSVYESDTEEGKKIKSALAKIKGELDDNDELKYVHVDYTSHDKRCASVFPTERDTLDEFAEYDPETSKGKIDIMEVENKMDFVNWVIVTGESDPMLYSLHHGGIWENQNIYDTVIQSTTLRRAVFPILKHFSSIGKPLDVDYTGEQDVMELMSGENAEVMVPPPIDQAMAQLSSQNTAKSSQTTGIKGLASIEIAGNVQYAAVQAVINLHKTTLVPYVRTWEKANSQLGDMAFMWLQQGEGFTEVAYRSTNQGEGKNAGDAIVVSPDKFDPDHLFISCTAVALDIGDKMQEANFYATLKNAGAHIAWKEVLENLSLGNGDVLEAEWLDEQAVTTALQMKVAELQAQLQMQQQQVQMQMQMQAQQMQMQQQAQMQQQQMAQQGGQVPPDQSNPMIPGGQGMNPAQGGSSAAQALPGATSPV